MQQSACQALLSVAAHSLCILAGLFLGPQMVGEALKGGRLIARVMDQEGYKVHTPSGAPSFITVVEVGSRDHMIAFCKAVQRASPVGSYIEPTPGKAFSHRVQCSAKQCSYTSACSRCIALSSLFVVEK